MEAFKLAKKFIELREKAVENAEKNIKKISENAKKILKDAKVYVFGSYVKGNFKPYWSDIDILIVSDEVKNKTAGERVKIKRKIKEGINYSFIFQIHLVSYEEFEYYKKFIDVMKEV
ncbi:MAG: nucleotidyltransferase domain-containing protein [Candidatus Aenigmatarchaeota archaeon]